MTISLVLFVSMSESSSVSPFASESSSICMSRSTGSSLKSTTAGVSTGVSSGVISSGVGSGSSFSGSIFSGSTSAVALIAMSSSFTRSVVLMKLNTIAMTTWIASDATTHGVLLSCSASNSLNVWVS